MPEPEEGFFQEAMVVNYPSPDVPFTRIVEYKHVPNQSEAVKAGKVKGTPGSRVRVSTPGHALTLTPTVTDPNANPNPNPYPNPDPNPNPYRSRARCSPGSTRVRR